MSTKKNAILKSTCPDCNEGPFVVGTWGVVGVPLYQLPSQERGTDVAILCRPGEGKVSLTPCLPTDTSPTPNSSAA